VATPHARQGAGDRLGQGGADKSNGEGLGAPSGPRVTKRTADEVYQGKEAAEKLPLKFR